jgi:ATP-binding cassette subfamily B protein
VSRGAGEAALHDVSLEARSGEITAIVGPAGAGKTTLIYLIPAFLRPQQGRVLFDDVDIASASPSSIRSQIAFVFQETALFDATVADNIRVGNPAATDAEVRRAASLAAAA